MKRTTLFLPQHYVKKVETFSQATGLLFSEIVRRALDAYLEREAPKLIETAAKIKKRRAKR